LRGKEGGRMVRRTLTTCSAQAAGEARKNAKQRGVGNGAKKGTKSHGVVGSHPNVDSETPHGTGWKWIGKGPGKGRKSR